jgi:hypothetical protein
MLKTGENNHHALYEAVVLVPLGRSLIKKLGPKK